jgi:hypothetical protein
MAFELTWTDEAEKNFSLRCTVCNGNWTGGSDTHDNALAMVNMIEENHVDQ